MKPENEPPSSGDGNAGQAALARGRACRQTAALFLALLAGATLARTVSSYAVVLGIAACCWLLTALFHRFFFRDPTPAVPAGRILIVAPAHGRVDCIEQVEKLEFIRGPAWRISTFLSVFDVHVQNAPVAGRVATVRHQPGQFINALRPSSAQRNENVLIGIEATEPAIGRVAVRQIAGTIARRIETWVKEGDSPARGHRLGMIRYGSRCDLYLPMTAQIMVKPGDKVIGGQTVIALHHSKCESQGPASGQAPAAES